MVAAVRMVTLDVMSHDLMNPVSAIVLYSAMPLSHGIFESAGAMAKEEYTLPYVPR